MKALLVAACVLVLSASACGSDSSSADGGAPCTKEALTEGVRTSENEDVEVLDGFVCEGEWAAGPYLVGAGAEQVEAAFIVKDEDGSWKTPASPPCDEGDGVPEKVLDRSPCRVS